MPKAKQKPLNHIAKLIAEVYEDAGLDQPYIEGKKHDMSGHENKFETLASAINLDAENVNACGQARDFITAPRCHRSSAESSLLINFLNRRRINHVSIKFTTHHHG